MLKLFVYILSKKCMVIGWDVKVVKFIEVYIFLLFLFLKFFEKIFWIKLQKVYGFG